VAGIDNQRNGLFGDNARLQAHRFLVAYAQTPQPLVQEHEAAVSPPAVARRRKYAMYYHEAEVARYTAPAPNGVCASRGT